MSTQTSDARFNALIEQVDGLAQLALEVQVENEKSGLDAARKLSEQYFDWYGKALAVLPSDLERKFRFEYEGSALRDRIKSFLNSPRAVNSLYGSATADARQLLGLSPWRYPASDCFGGPVNSQKQLLIEAKTRAEQAPEPSTTASPLDQPDEVSPPAGHRAEARSALAASERDLTAAERSFEFVPGRAVEAKKEPKPRTHVFVWIGGVVIASLLPLIWAYAASSPGSAPPSIWQLSGGGDIFMFSIVLVMAGLTEILLLLERIKPPGASAALLIGGFFIALVSAAKYAGTTELMSVHNISPAAMPHSVTYWSIALFTLAAIHSSVCVYLGAGAR